MFVDCSEISIGVVVKHVQHVGIIRAFCLPGKFFSAWGDRKTFPGLAGPQKWQGGVKNMGVTFFEGEAVDDMLLNKFTNWLAWNDASGVFPWIWWIFLEQLFFETHRNYHWIFLPSDKIRF